MSLNNNQMLPERVRSMRQMKDVLIVEDMLLAEIELIIDEMYERASILHEELVNEAWLESKLAGLIHGKATVQKRKNSLVIDVSIDKGQLSGVGSGKVKVFLDKWLPAHLAYVIVYEMMMSADVYVGTVWQDDEILTLRQVIV